MQNLKNLKNIGKILKTKFEGFKLNIFIDWKKIP
jgi:hypothetical protein